MAYELIVQFCAPTLAGIKVASLFSYRYKNEDKLEKEVRSKNNVLNKKGIYMVILKKQNGLALIYLYRKNELEKELQKEEIFCFLKEKGYFVSDIESCLAVLSTHLKEAEFPHEIGAFLGYPIEDIRAFISNKGKNYKLIGYWKVYHDVVESQKIFTKYNKCTEIYCQKFYEGFDITRLTVAG